MSLVIAGDAVVKPEVVLPIQFQRIWDETATTTPENALAVCVLCRAADDLLTYRYAQRRGGQRLYVEAYIWVASNGYCWPYSVLNLCEVLRLSPNVVRRELLSDALSDRTSRIRGAAGRVPRSLRITSFTGLRRQRCSKSVQ